MRVSLAVVVALGLAASPLLIGTAAAEPTSAEPTSEGRQTRPVPALSDMVTDERTAVQAVNAFWKRHFRENFDKPYNPPQIRGAYRGQNGPRCGAVRSIAFNAFYCRPGDFLAWDQDLMSAGYQQIGDAWVYVIIAHEWGHAIQARLGRGWVSRDAELQADCLAGATLQGLTRDPGGLTIEPGDNREIENALVLVADKYAWSNSHDHGSAEQRVNAYNMGVGGGVAACFR